MEMSIWISNRTKIWAVKARNLLVNILALQSQLKLTRKLPRKWAEALRPTHKPQKDWQGVQLPAHKPQKVLPVVLLLTLKAPVNLLEAQLPVQKPQKDLPEALPLTLRAPADWQEAPPLTLKEQGELLKTRGLPLVV